MIELKRYKDESDQQFIYRVCKEKERNGLSWQEISDICNEELALNYSESWYRRRWSGYKDIKEAKTDNDLSGNEILNAIKEQRIQLQKDRYKNQTIAVELNRLRRQESRFEFFYESIADKIETLPVPKFEYNGYIDTNPKEYILSIADIHGGAQFITINNEYSMEICNDRFKNLLNKTIDYVRRNNITCLKVLGLGDDVQGILRLKDLLLNQTSVVEATVFVAKTIASFLNSLSKYCYVEFYQTPTSNHSQTRPLGTKASELASEDVEYVIGNYIKDVLVNNSNVEVFTNFGNEYIEIPIFDLNVVAMHGHQVNNIENAIKDLSMLHRKFYQYLFLAHFHAGKELVVGECITGDVEVLVCPSFVGSCPYSDRLMKGSKSACKIFIFDEKDGLIGTEKFILN